MVLHTVYLCMIMRSEGRFSHKELCQLAQARLERPDSKRGPGCQFAFSETAQLGAIEIADAIGFRYDDSVLIEVKTSRNDFLADRKKAFRMEPSNGMGVYRYYMAPERLIGIDKLPEKWGLIEVTTRRIKPRCGHVFLKYGDPDVWRHERNWQREMTFLVRMLARINDPEMVNRAIKNSQYLMGRAQQSSEQWRKRHDELQHKYFTEVFARQKEAG